jgi:hypothetical protein
MKICFQAFFHDFSTSAPFTSLKQNHSSTLLHKLCVHYATVLILHNAENQNHSSMLLRKLCVHYPNGFDNT